MTNKEYQEFLGNIIELLMKHESRQWSCDTLSSESNVDVRTVRRNLKAETVSTMLTIRKFSKAFGIKPGQVLTMVDDLCEKMEDEKNVG